jgi:hypothetical protein
MHFNIRNIKFVEHRVESRIAFSIWCCELHNEVNAKMGYATYPCDIQSLDHRWRIPGPNCLLSAQEEENSSEANIIQPPGAMMK